MENKNPLSPHIQIYRWHISSLVSISHRITGIINIIAITLICIWVSLLVLGDVNYNFINIYDNDYLEVVRFFTDPISKFLFSLFIIFAYFFSALSISEAFEDYITDNKIKYVANRLLYISAITIPLLTIIFLFNLNL